MLRILQNQTFARLFAAQVTALLGTGLLTIALALLAYDLAGDRAGVVLGTALTIKMVAYVVLSPLAQALTAGLARKSILIGANIVRGSVAVGLPFVTEVWQVYVLIFVLQAASATFTPTFQATIPDVLPDEGDYTRALSLSRLAYEIENIASPAVAGLLLTWFSYHWLFLGTVGGFALSAILVWIAVLPRPAIPKQRPFLSRLTLGLRIYAGTPRLRGLLALNLTVAATGSFAIVNTVVLMNGNGPDVAKAMAGFGLGAICIALVMPRLLDRIDDRRVMVPAALLAPPVLAALALILSDGVEPSLIQIFFVWAVMGALGSAIMTPSARLLRRSAHDEDRAAIFTAQFAASHGCWLFMYPTAGWTGATFGLSASAGILAIFAAVGAVLAMRLWPRKTRGPIEHSHDDLPDDHPHLHGGGHVHRHPIIIDEIHPSWPKSQ